MCIFVCVLTVYVFMCRRISMYASIHLCVHIYVFIHLRMRFMCVYINVCLWKRVFIICVRAFMCVCVCACIINEVKSSSGYLRAAEQPPPRFSPRCYVPIKKKSIPNN